MSLPERLLEAALYVPVGVVSTLASDLPSLAERGRREVENRVQVARMVGKLAVAETRRRLGSLRAATPAGGDDKPEESLRGGAAVNRETTLPVTAERGRGVDGTEKAARRREPAASPAGRAGARRADGGGVPDVGALPIPGYDTLAASQVVQRLSSLRPDELDAVRRYEVATRGRRTILHRIGQLSSADGRASA